MDKIVLLVVGVVLGTIIGLCIHPSCGVRAGQTSYLKFLKHGKSMVVVLGIDEYEDLAYITFDTPEQANEALKRFEIAVGNYERLKSNSP